MKSSQTILDAIHEKLGIDLSQVKKIVSEEGNKPLTAAVFGQTGTGKSSLTNTLFGTNFKVDDTRPCTKEPQKHTEKSVDGKTVTFWDLPGLGELDSADSEYIQRYIDIAKSSDVILWVFQADTRSLLIDKMALKKIADNLQETERKVFLSKITVVLTKADSIAADSWILAKNDNALVAVPGSKTEKILNEKALYFYDELFKEYKDILIHRIRLNSECKTELKLHTNLWIDIETQKIIQEGSIPDTEWEMLIKKHSAYADELTELQKSQRGIICSAKYHYNLNEVKYRIVNRTEGLSILRMANKITTKVPDICWRDISSLNIPILYDATLKKYLFNTETIIAR